MTSLKQIEANRRNAQKSTGPTSAEGKQRSSRNAVRHGLAAETVIVPIEDVEDYQAFEEAVAASFDPETSVERELILRLASLLWRLRRATSIETGLFQIGSAGGAEYNQRTGPRPHTPKAVVRILRLSTNSLSKQVECDHREPQDTPSHNLPSGSRSIDMQLLLAQRFMGLEALNGAFERISRYELALWRQVRQVLLALQGLRRGNSRRQFRAQRYTSQGLGLFAPHRERSEEY